MLVFGRAQSETRIVDRHFSKPTYSYIIILSTKLVNCFVNYRPYMSRRVAERAEYVRDNRSNYFVFMTNVRAAVDRQIRQSLRLAKCTR